MKQKTITIGLVLWWLLIFGLTSLPGNSLPKPAFFGIDKVVHIVMYGGLAFWLTLFLNHRGLTGVKLFLLVVIVSVLYSFFDEWHQPFVGRTFSYYDIVANCIGALLVSLPVTFFCSRKRVVCRAD